MPLIVTIDLVPGGDAMQSREIGRLVIVNNGTNREAPEYGNYNLLLRTETSPSRWVETAGTAEGVTRTADPWGFLHEFLERMETDA